jgi:hypothetical protein
MLLGRAVPDRSLARIVIAVLGVIETIRLWIIGG